MGTTYWSDDEYRERAAFLRRAGKGAFEFHDLTMRLPERERHVHEKMNPFGVAFRESRDSEAHPDSRAVAVLFDVTGSMGSVPRILQQNLCQLMDLLLAKKYLTDPQILIGGIGDATCDRAPLQIGQFESGIEIDQDLAKLWLEGGGGGQKSESYELAMYFMARHTSIDCLEKRGRRGYLFLIGDEMPYRFVRRSQVEALLGERPEKHIPIKEIIRELEQKYDTYYILPNLTSYYRDPEILDCWQNLLGDRVMRLEDPQAISELVAATIGLKEGIVDLGGIEADLRETGRGHLARVVTQAIEPLAQNEPALACHQAAGLAATVGLATNLTGVSPKPGWHFDFGYKSRRWQFVMRYMRALTRR